MKRIISMFVIAVCVLLLANDLTQRLQPVPVVRKQMPHFQSIPYPVLRTKTVKKPIRNIAIK